MTNASQVPKTGRNKPKTGRKKLIKIKKETKLKPENINT